MVLRGLSCHWRLASWPISCVPFSSMAKMDGMMNSPPLYGTSLTAPFSTMAAHELVVPRSMPMILLTECYTTMVDSVRYLKSVGEQVQGSFLGNRTLLAFQEYMEAFFDAPRVHARDAAHYIRDCFDFYGTETLQTPSGPVRRFKLFDRPFDAPTAEEGEAGSPVVGQEEVQNAIYRILNSFVRAGRVHKLILLHGPNGSAKSSLVAAIQRALEDYSRHDEGAVYRFNWIFPNERLVKGSIGFGDKVPEGQSVESYAHLEGEQIDAGLACEMKDHPLFLLPRAERQKLLAT